MYNLTQAVRISLTSPTAAQYLPREGKSLIQSTNSPTCAEHKMSTTSHQDNIFSYMPAIRQGRLYSRTSKRHLFNVMRPIT